MKDVLVSLTLSAVALKVTFPIILRCSPGNVLTSNTTRLHDVDELLCSITYEMITLGIPTDHLNPLRLTITTCVPLFRDHSSTELTQVHSFHRDTSSHTSRYKILRSTWWMEWSSPIELAKVYTGLVQCSLGLRRVQRTLIVCSRPSFLHPA